MDFQVVAVIGLGLIGGSIARGLRAAGFAGQLRAAVASRTDALRARELALVDVVETDVGRAAAAADLVIVAVPVAAMAAVFAELAPVLAARTVVTDVGSTKQGVIADARTALGPRFARFVPGHPIAGTEHSGLEAGFARLYRGRRVILTPGADTERGAVATVEALWAALGARVCTMAPAHHDAVLAATSHLPHVAAFALVDTLASMAGRTEIFDYAAGGFADFTRIASSDPALWTGIVGANRDAILPVLDAYLARLTRLRAAIARGEHDRLAACFGRAKAARDRFTEDPPK